MNTKDTPQPAGDAAIAQAFREFAEAEAGSEGIMEDAIAGIMRRARQFETARAIQGGNPSVDDRLKDLTIEQLRTRLGHCETALAERDATLMGIQAGKGEPGSWFSTDDIDSAFRDIGSSEDTKAAFHGELASSYRANDYSVGQRVIWTSRQNVQFPGVIESVQPARYTVRLDNGNCAENTTDIKAEGSQGEGVEWPECSGTPNDCPENEGHGCCKNNSAASQADECSAISTGHHFSNCGPNGEVQCRYCGEEPATTPDPAAPDGDALAEDAIRAACEAYDLSAQLEGETGIDCAQYTWMSAALAAAQNNGWRVHGWRMVGEDRVFTITPPSGLLPPQEFVRYDAHLAALSDQRVGEAVAVVHMDGYPKWLASWLTSENYQALPTGTKLYVMPPNAQHWHDRFQKESQLRRDDAARYGEQILILETATPLPDDYPPTAIPDGMVVVSREPTEAMLAAASKTPWKIVEPAMRAVLYRAMIAAAPGSAEGGRG